MNLVNKQYMTKEQWMKRAAKLEILREADHIRICKQLCRLFIGYAALMTILLLLLGDIR